MNKLKGSLVCAAALLVLSELAFSSSNIRSGLEKIKTFFADPNQHEQNHVDLLFLQQADSGSLFATQDKKSCYQLTLKKLRDNVLYFTNQPQRNAGNITNHEFMELWRQNAIQPNVVLQAFELDPKKPHEINIVATLKNPEFNENTHQWSYTACVILKNRNNSLNTESVELKNISLFIDPFHSWRA